MADEEGTSPPITDDAEQPLQEPTQEEGQPVQDEPLQELFRRNSSSEEMPQEEIPVIEGLPLDPLESRQKPSLDRAPPADADETTLEVDTSPPEDPTPQGDSVLADGQTLPEPEGDSVLAEGQTLPEPEGDSILAEGQTLSEPEGDSVLAEGQTLPEPEGDSVLAEGQPLPEPDVGAVLSEDRKPPVVDAVPLNDHASPEGGIVSPENQTLPAGDTVPSEDPTSSEVVPSEVQALVVPAILSEGQLSHDQEELLSIETVRQELPLGIPELTPGDENECTDTPLVESVVPNEMSTNAVDEPTPPAPTQSTAEPQTELERHPDSSTNCPPNAPCVCVPERDMVIGFISDLIMAVIEAVGSKSLITVTRKQG
jgi:hypothetical protein